MSKTVRVYDLVTKRVNTIPAAELAPGMVQAQVEGVGRVWINSVTVKLSGKFKHPPLEPGLRDIIEREIQKPLADVWPKTLAPSLSRKLASGVGLPKGLRNFLNPRV